MNRIFYLRQHLDNFFLGARSILCLDPQSTHLKPSKKLYNPHSSTSQALYQDWEKIGQDITSSIKEEIKNYEKK